MRKNNAIETAGRPVRPESHISQTAAASMWQTIKNCPVQHKIQYKTALLGVLGRNLSGSAIGVLIAKFVLWCRENDYAPVLDFRGVERIGSGLVESALMYYEDHYGECNKKAVRVIRETDSGLRNPDDAAYLSDILSAPPSRRPLAGEAEADG